MSSSPAPAAKFAIRHRWTDAVLFECDVPAVLSSGLRQRVAVENAVAARANLGQADLSGFCLAWANLAGAKLVEANLKGADLTHANLAGAYLFGPELEGAYVNHLRLIGKRPVMWIGPFGQERRTMHGWVTQLGLRVQCGDFFGTRDEFAKQIAETYGDNEHSQEYTAALALLDAHAKLWASKEVVA